MQELMLAQRSRSLKIIAIFTCLEAISMVAMLVLNIVLPLMSIQNATLHHKPTAAALTTGLMIIGTIFYGSLSFVFFFLAYGIKREKPSALWTKLAFEVIVWILHLCLVFNVHAWPILIELWFSAVSILYMLFDRNVRRMWWGT